MNDNSQPFSRWNRDPSRSAPFGVSPTGEGIHSVEELPILPIPSRIVVERDCIEIDGWLFPYSYVSKSWLVWFQQSFLRWRDLDKSERNRQWIEGMVHAFELRLIGDPDASSGYTRT